MSLYKFTDKNIKECPNMLITNNGNVNFKNILIYYRLKQKRYPIESFINILFYDSIVKCSQNIIEIDILQNRLKKISQISQTIFDLNLSLINLQ